MKTLYALTYCLLILILSNSNLFASVGDTCGTTGTITSNSIPLSGTIKVFVVFAQFKDDPNNEDNGWAKNEYPDWANTFVNPSTGGPYPWYNLSHYFNQMSVGDFQVIGDVYGSLVITNYNESTYNSIGEINYEILTRIDPYVNFSDYDNLNGTSFGQDGKVDFIYIIYRNSTNSTLWRYTGIARLELSQTINADGVQIVSGAYIGSGVQLTSGYWGRDYTMYNSAHELGHYLFGSGHIDYITNLGIMVGYPVWNGGKGMMSWERERLGWINYTDKSTDGTIALSDYLTNNQVIRVPVSSNEYFLIENHRHFSPHDKSGDVGFYAYYISNATYFPPNIDVLCADGKWNFTIDTSHQKLYRTTMNVNGYDEMNFYQKINGIGYSCHTPVYFENSAWGDDEDAFDLSFNNVLSPASNPNTANSGSIEFSVEIVGNYILHFYFDGDGTDEFVGKPSKPQNIQITWYNNHPKITWNANGEPDLDHYEIYKKRGGGNYNYFASTTNTYYVDNSEWKFSAPNSKIYVYYKIKAVDEDDYESVFSNEVNAAVSDYESKRIAENEDVILKPNTYRLSSNYPNPFNPTTVIEYQLAKNGFVTLDVYNMLGEKVVELLNGFEEAGYYSIKFDGSDLPSGTYLYKIQAGDFSDAKKMLLLK